MNIPTLPTRIMLVRSPSELVSKNQIGYGWGQANFSTFTTANDIISFINNETPHTVGRHKNQIRRYFELAKGDIVVVPLYRAIVLGVVEGTKSHTKDVNIKNGENRIQVNFFTDEDGQAIRIPRAKLSQGLESRLKIRMSVISLHEFREELTQYLSQLQENKNVCFDSLFQQDVDKQIEDFKKQLLVNLRGGNTKLKAGGYGLEELVKELLEIEGYIARIEAKNQSSGISDIDITATRNDPVSSNRVYIQVKHHKGETDQHAVQQLIPIEDDEHHDKWVITTASVSAGTVEAAKDNNIQIMAGEALVDWVYDRIEALSPRFKEQLGVAIMPQLV